MREAEPAIELDGSFILRVDDDREYSDGPARIESAPDGVGKQQAADPFRAHVSVAGEPPDQSGRHRTVAGKLPGDLGRKILDRDRKRAQCVESDDLLRFVEADEDAGDISPFVLPGAFSKPVIELGAAGRERASIMPGLQRLDRKGRLRQPSISR